MSTGDAGARRGHDVGDESVVPRTLKEAVGAVSAGIGCITGR